MTVHSSLGVEKNELEAVNQIQHLNRSVQTYLDTYLIETCWCIVTACPQSGVTYHLNKSTCELEGEWERVGLYHYHF